MAFILKDDQVQSYHELWDFVPGVVENQTTPNAGNKGWARVYQDVFGFNMVASLTITDEVTFIYEATQVIADKGTGTGETITAGQKVYTTLTSAFQTVTANPTGTIGTDYYFVGWAKKDATASEDTVLIRFWGHEYNHADRSA